MKWSIPAKTFLLGEYAALLGSPALLITTTPCFELTLSESGLDGIHPNSPAGRWWAVQNQNRGLQWFDPYQGKGGMGASSAQFIGAYLASCRLEPKINGKSMESSSRSFRGDSHSDLLEAYLKSAWSGEGMAPSGYDVLAQVLYGCVYINKMQGTCQQYAWPFREIGFLLLHTGEKLATHDHLQHVVLPEQTTDLAATVDRAKDAFENANSSGLITAINAYHEQLVAMDLVALHTKQHITSFRKQKDILAAKGCGALGTDVILLIVPMEKQSIISKDLSRSGWTVLASTHNLYQGPALIRPLQKLY